MSKQRNLIDYAAAVVKSPTTTLPKTLRGRTRLADRCTELVQAAIDTPSERAVVLAAFVVLTYLAAAESWSTVRQHVIEPNMYRAGSELAEAAFEMSQEM
jgi:hypothetical protein